MRIQRVKPVMQVLISSYSFGKSSRGDAWCLLRGFESRLGLESSGCSMWHFLKLVARGFLRVLRFPPLLHQFNGSANKIKLK